MSTKNPFRFPSIQNEDIFSSKLQEAPSVVNTKKLKSHENPEESFYTSYSTLKFTGDDANDEGYVGKAKNKAPKRSTSPNPTQYFKLEQSFGTQQFKFDQQIDDTGPKSGRKPSAKPQKSPSKLFKSTEDDFKDSEFFDFSIHPKPGQSNAPSGKYGKIKSDLGVKGLAIKPTSNKFDPQFQGGFQPSFKLRDFPNIHTDVGSGIASAGQIKTFYGKEEALRDERIKQKLSKDNHPASKAQYAQFLRAKEDERLEKLAEEQFKLQQQKQSAQEKEAQLKQQQQQLQRQKDKIKSAEKQLNDKVTRQTVRPKRRPSPPNSRRQRNPSPVNFSSGQPSSLPMRQVSDGTYRVSFNI